MTNGAAPKRRCGTMELHRHLSQVDAVYRANRRQIETFTAQTRLAPRTTVVRIPVVVHVLFHTGEENVTDAQIQSQIDVLNPDFRKLNPDASDTPLAFQDFVADSRIEFGLARRAADGNPTRGITRTQTPVPSFSGDIPDLDREIKSANLGSLAWPRDQYLNMWVCNLADSLLGYATFPGGPAALDGVVINYKAFGTSGTAAPPLNLGRTATHEVGHWLNLLHIWGDDGGGCTGSDNVTDTPNQAGPNNGRPTHPRPSCNNQGDMFMNYMDYTDDASMFMFTKGQVTRIDAALAGPRSAILSSNGLISVGSERIDLLAPDVAVVRAAFTTTPERGDRGTRVFDGVEWVE